MNMSVLTLQEYEFEKQFNEHAAIQWMQENWSQPREALVISRKFCGHLAFQLTVKQKTPSYFVHHDDV
ncbi:elongation of very long chain fatty acids protein 6 [Grus japonensis]|uniref:Elongation of very long chain fatty acids protein 6 n=1 Tax=Grus japonensis TaxID=30415 RepID=A0ABC9WUL5_GRUJA